MSELSVFDTHSLTFFFIVWIYLWTHKHTEWYYSVLISIPSSLEWLHTITFCTVVTGWVYSYSFCSFAMTAGSSNGWSSWVSIFSSGLPMNSLEVYSPTHISSDTISLPSRPWWIMSLSCEYSNRGILIAPWQITEVRCWCIVYSDKTGRLKKSPTWSPIPRWYMSTYFLTIL